MTLDLAEHSGMIPEVQATKENIDKLNLIKIKNFCTSKETIKRVDNFVH